MISQGQSEGTVSAKALRWECVRKRKQTNVRSRVNWEMTGKEVRGVAGFYVGGRLSTIKSCPVF